MSLLEAFFFVGDFFNYKASEIHQNRFSFSITEMQLSINNINVYFLHDHRVYKTLQLKAYSFN